MVDSYVVRTIESILPHESEHFLIVVTGARQVGKTTLLKHSYPRFRYLNLDSVENRDFLLRQSESLWHTLIGPAILDEIQKQPELVEKVKYSWDSGALARTAMTGSSHLLLLRHIRESLAGRVRLLELFALGVGELTGLPAASNLFDRLCDDEVDIARLAPELLPEESARLRAAEEEVYRWGGMPALLGLGPEARKEWLADYRSTYLQRDLVDLARLRDLLPFMTFQRISALRVGGLVNFADLARDAGLSADTARRYLEYLRISYQTELLQPWFANPGRRLVKTPKLVFLDMGLLRSISATWELDSGEYFENFLVAEMLKQLRTLKKEARPFFWRTSNGAEVDIILETPRGIWGMEIKNRPEVGLRDARHLRALASELGPRWLGGLVLHRGSRIEALGEPNIWAMPSWRLFSGPRST
jgi:predicted AAA+ superfamily ATPase